MEINKYDVEFARSKLTGVLLIGKLTRKLKQEYFWGNYFADDDALIPIRLESLNLTQLATGIMVWLHAPWSDWAIWS